MNANKLTSSFKEPLPVSLIRLAGTDAQARAKLQSWLRVQLIGYERAVLEAQDSAADPEVIEILEAERRLLEHIRVTSS